MNLNYWKCKACILLLILPFFAISQTTSFQKDSLSMNLVKAEQTFLENNLLLLAQKYNIDAQKALIIQAKLYPNPNLNINQGVYHTQLNKFFPTGDDAETLGGISQLIITARKRNKQIKLAEENVKLTEYQFYDLIRTLKYTLRTDFFNIYYLMQSLKVYNVEIKSLEQVVNAFNEQQGKGYISEKEVVRIKAQLYSLQSEYNDLINQINDTESELRLLVQLKSSFIMPIVEEDKINKLNTLQYSLNSLIDSAYQNRTDLKIANSLVNLSKGNFELQKSLATPDITLQMGYDKQGSYIKNFNSLGIGVDIPIFNRNQGNIKSAKYLISNAEANQKSTAAAVEEQIARAYLKAIDQDKLLRKSPPLFQEDFTRLVNEILINYQRRNIGLLEFIDFYDSYKQNILQINSIRFNRVSAFEDINFYTGTNYFN